jgi:TRAP-type C4-dicarboxylate transport system permease small subunit
MLDRALKFLDRGFGALSEALVAAIVLVLTAQIVFRYAFNSSILWSEEVATWCMVWTVYMGAASLMSRWQHVHIPMFVQRLPLSVRPYVIVTAKIATLAACLLVTWYGIVVVDGTYNLTSQSTGVSTSWIKLAIPIGMAAMAVFALSHVVADLRAIRRGDLSRFETYGDLNLDLAPDGAPDSASGDLRKG